MMLKNQYIGSKNNRSQKTDNLSGYFETLSMSSYKG